MLGKSYMFWYMLFVGASVIRWGKGYLQELFDGVTVIYCGKGELYGYKLSVWIKVIR